MGDVIDTTPMFYADLTQCTVSHSYVLTFMFLADAFSRELLVQKSTMFVKINAWFEILETKLGRNLEKRRNAQFLQHILHIWHFTHYIS